MKLAFALAEKVSESPITDTSERAGEFLKFLKSQGADYAGVTLTDPWQRDRLASFGQLALVAVLPLSFGLMVSMAGGSKTPGGADTTPSSNYLPTATSSSMYPETAPEPDVPTCKRELRNGQRLDGNMILEKSGHVLEIENGSGGSAIVKIRKWPSRKLAISFFVKDAKTAKIEGIPDGEYSIQYAFGPKIAQDCMSFTKLTAAGEFPRIGELLTTREPVADGVIVSHHRLSYTLYSVPSGNVRPQAIDAPIFNAD